jgi:CheY-like chemotaxis protein
LERFLEKNGYPGRRASCPSEAEAILREDRISGVIADPSWIRGETLAVLGALIRAQELRALPIIVLSDRADDLRNAAGTGMDRTFWISPRTAERQMLSLLQREMAAGPERFARIFHVSNSAEAREAVRSTFEGLAHVVEAESLDEGWSQLRKDAFDLLISDIHLRDGCALELIPLLPNIGMEKMPVVVFSDSELPGKALPLVDVRLVRSRTTPQQLLACVQSLLQAARNVRSACLAEES